MPQLLLQDLIHKPVVTEKTYQLAQLNQYVFYVNKEANKIELTRAFETLFEGRKVISVRFAKKHGKTKRAGRRLVQLPSRKKAIFHIEGEPLAHVKGF